MKMTLKVNSEVEDSVIITVLLRVKKSFYILLLLFDCFEL